MMINSKKVLGTTLENMFKHIGIELDFDQNEIGTYLSYSRENDQQHNMKT